MTALVPQYVISAACEEDLARYGDSFRGAGYTKSPQEAAERYALMLDVVRETDTALTILDLGCGLGHLLDFIQSDSAHRHLRYVGLDISPKYLAAAQARHPRHEFILMDLLEADDALPVFDYVVLNGVFNYRGPIEQGHMVEYWERLISIAYRHCRSGIAFNVMSTLVDWERGDLFHLPIDTMTRFVWTRLSRYFVVRHDYQAFEYTTYVYRRPFTAIDGGAVLTDV
jgi:SAM-dependent methyltransferase